MKKITSLVAGIFISTILIAQTPITITSSDMPNENDEVLVSVNNNIGAIDPSLTGANFNWDFSSLTPNVQQFEKFDSPLTFTSPYNYLFNPFNTSYGRNNYEFSTISLPGGTEITAAYDFYKESSSQYKQIGAGFTVNNMPIPFLYAQEDIIYEFPMNHLNTDDCNYKYGLDIPGMGYYGQSGHRVNLVDGWGTLITPFGTFQTLRVISTIDAIDTVYNTSLSAGTNIPRPLKYEFKWLATGKKIPVLKIEATDIAGNITVSNVRYTDSTRAGVPQVGIAENKALGMELAVYPNPCVDEIKVNYKLPTTTHVKISITNVIGKTIANVVDQTQLSGAHQKSISIADLHLNSGIYFINLQTDKFKEIQKIVVSR